MQAFYRYVSTFMQSKEGFVILDINYLTNQTLFQMFFLNFSNYKYLNKYIFFYSYINTDQLFFLQLINLLNNI